MMATFVRTMAAHPPAHALPHAAAGAQVIAGAQAAGEQPGFSEGITVRVELDGAAKIIPGATVFISASLPAGGMPFAVVRLPVEGLPAEVTLDDTTAMVAGRALSHQTEVRVTARVSASGNALGRTGDWQGRSERLTPDTVPPVVFIRIDQEI